MIQWINWLILLKYYGYATFSRLELQESSLRHFDVVEEIQLNNARGALSASILSSSFRHKFASGSTSVNSYIPSTKPVTVMSAEYEGQDPLEIAKQAERDLNSSAMKQGDGRNQRYDNSTSGISFLSTQ